MSQRYMNDILVTIKYEQPVINDFTGSNEMVLKYTCMHETFEKAMLDATNQIGIIEKGGGDVSSVEIDFIARIGFTEKEED